MKILLVGNGGRENALAWKIFNSRSFQESSGTIYCTVGNPGIEEFAKSIKIKAIETDLLADYALKENIDFTVVGPEVPLASGIVNKFNQKGLKIFGPTKEAAEIESSKIFSKRLMADNDIPTAKYKKFTRDNLKEVKSFLEVCSYPVVIKADGLAAGKGVIISENFDESISAINEFSSSDTLLSAGTDFIIEEFLSGEEISVFVITDGSDYVVLPYAQDHKKILDGEKGKNTGGMGAVSPVMKFENEGLGKIIKDRIIDPTLKALKLEGREFKGCLYCGLMIVDNEPYVIEFNCRFGDPETQAVLPLIESDFLNLLMASSRGEIKNYKLVCNNKYSCCVVLASKGYPGNYNINKEIADLTNDNDNVLIFHSGTKFSDEKKIVSAGGRVLSVVGISENSLEDALRNAYNKASEIDFENKYFRKDIGFRQLTVNS